MIRQSFIALFLVVAGLLQTISVYAQNTGKPIVLRNQTDTISYALGTLLGGDLMAGGFKDINYDILKSVMQKALKGDSLQMDRDEANEILQNFASAEMRKKSAANNAASAEFLIKNRTEPGVISTPSGLQYKIVTTGKGPKPGLEQTVKVHYTGKLINGMIFDSSIGRGTPAEFKLKDVIPGWTEALQMMPVGSKWILFIPPYLGYGDQDMQSIPGGSVLIFEVELLDIVN